MPAAALDQPFRQARAHSEFSGEVSTETLHRRYDLPEWGPTLTSSSLQGACLILAARIE